LSPRTELAYRPLTREEHEFLTWLLKHSQPEATDFLPQLEVLKARSSCDCGCPSIEFTVPIEAPYIEPARQVEIKFSGMSGEVSVGLFLLTGGGVLSELEVFSFGGVDHPFGLPDVNKLQPFEPQPPR
jgi:hypothetical protein